MRKVLVDREEIEAVRNTLANGGGAVGVLRWAESVLAAQPAEAEGVERWNGLKLAAEVAEEDGPWDPRVGLTDCEAAFAKSASPAVVLELIAALSAVTAERDNYKSWYDEAMDASNIAGFAGMSAAQVIDYQDKEIMQLRAELEMLRDNNRKAAISDAAMAAKEG